MFNSENRQLIVDLIKRWIRECRDTLMSNSRLSAGLRKIETAVVLFSRRVLSPVVREVCRSNGRSAAAGFVAGVALSWLLYGRRPKQDCPIKPQCISRAILCKEPNDRKR